MASSDRFSSASSLATRVTNKARLLLKSRAISLNVVGTAAFLLRKSSREPRRARYRGLPFVMRRSDWFAVEEVLLHEEYGFVRQLLEERLGPECVVYDLGANIGCFALYTAALAQRARLVSVEPDPATFRVLERNRELNPGLDWSSVQAAIWKDDAGVQLQHTNWSTATSVVASTDGHAAVPSLRLDALAESLGHTRVDLVKMDIEGAEEQALGACEAFLDRVQALVIELHPKRCDAPAVRALLARHFQRLSDIPGRQSQKPLLLATR